MKIGKLEINPLEIELKHWIKFKIEPIGGKKALDTLKRGQEIVHTTGINNWVASGTLLGIYRDGKLMDHDTDIDVNVSAKWNSLQANVQSKQIVIGLTNNGFQIIRTQVLKNHFMQLATIDTKTGVIFDVCFFYSGIVPRKAVHICQEGFYLMPIEFITFPAYMKFEGKDYPIPRNPDKHLEWQYGKDWQTPTGKKVAWQEEAPSLQKWT